MSKSDQLSFSKETGEIPSEEVKVLSVSVLNSLIKGSLEDKFSLVWLKGEISNFKAHSSGHFYFSLKDKKSQIQAVMFRGFNSRLKFKPQDGMEVIVRGRITVYEPRGNYQILVEKMDAVGAGSLQKAFEELKLKLKKQGLFNQEHKKTLPILPKKVALITSPSGAAVRDMIQVLGRRYKAAKILVIPVLTQGEAASKSLIKAVQVLDSLNCDVAIIGRGGGSIEDLWGFNSEDLARQIYNCQTPIVSAVGHEIDFTICDFVCDVRAPTPSAAAELVSQNISDLLEDLKTKQKAMNYYLKNILSRSETNLRALNSRLVDPKRKLQDMRLRCDEKLQRLTSSIAEGLKYKRLHVENLQHRNLKFKNFLLPLLSQLEFLKQRLVPSFQNHFKNKQTRFSRKVELLDSYNPLSVIHRGFAVVRQKSETGEIIKNQKQLKIGDQLWVGLSSGSLKTKLTEIEENKEWEKKTKRTKSNLLKPN